MPFTEIKPELENTCPKWLQESISRFKESYHKYKTDPSYSAFDCDILEFESDINNAEVNDTISSDAAWYLRQAYLGEDQKETI